MIKKFSPVNIDGYIRKLNAYEVFYCRTYPPVVMYFSGKIDIDKLSSVLEKVLPVFNFFYCYLQQDKDGIYAKYNPSDEKYYIPLEYETSNLDIEDAISNPIDLLPKSIDTRVTNASADVDGLPMLYLRCTKLNEGFVISLYYNHAFIDMSSIIYFIKTLCDSYKNENFIINPGPKLLETYSVLDDGSKNVFNSLEQFREFGNTIGREYCPDLTKIKLTRAMYTKLVPCKLVFDVEKLNLFKAATAKYISYNDIINAVILKIHANDASLNQISTTTLEFACDMRKHLKLDTSSIGVIAANINIRGIDNEDTKNQSIEDIAIKLRLIVAATDKSIYFQLINWYQNFELNKEDAGLYIPKFAVDNTAVLTTNWASFDYSVINFDSESKIIALEHPEIALPYVAIITFNNINGNKIVVNITIPDNVINYARILSKKSGLFDIKESNLSI